MRIISRKRLKDYWTNHTDIREPLQAWYADVKKAKWKSPTDIKNVYSNASIITNNRVVFNIKGNKYRLVVAINYEHSIVYIRFIGSHKEYDLVDVSTI
jgi:mRNA interferase HigB